MRRPPLLPHPSAFCEDLSGGPGLGDTCGMIFAQSPVDAIATVLHALASETESLRVWANLADSTDG